MIGRKRLWRTNRNAPKNSPAGRARRSFLSTDGKTVCAKVDIERILTNSWEVEEAPGGLFSEKFRLKIKILSLVVVAILIILIFGVALPLALDNDETQYLSDATLKSAVDIGDLEVVDYTYKGIADKTSQFLWAENVDYRVKYEAHVRASYDMSAIDFRVNNEDKSVTVLLPDVEISDPVLDETKFGYLPENATADVRDVIALCKEDVASEFSDAGLRTEAMESVRETVEALIRPLLDSAWQIEFEEVSAKEESGREGMQNEAE